MSFSWEDQNVDTSSMTEESVFEGSNTVSAEGDFHVQITDVEINDSDEKKLPYVKLTMEILAGTVEDQKGNKVYHRLFLASWEDKEKKKMGPLSEGQAKGLMAFLFAFGVVGSEAFAGNCKITRDMMTNLEHTQGIVKITKGRDRTVTDKKTGEKTEYAGRYEIAWNSDCKPIGHEAVKDVPVDHEAAAMRPPTGGGGGGEQAKNDYSEL